VGGEGSNDKEMSVGDLFGVLTIATLLVCCMLLLLRPM
jgi:hypothetical protein